MAMAMRRTIHGPSSTRQEGEPALYGPYELSRRGPPVSDAKCGRNTNLKKLRVALLLLAAACRDQPAGVAIGHPPRILQTLSLSVGQRLDITPERRAEYDSLPAMSSSAVAFLGMHRVTAYNPEGPPVQLQVYHFVATAAGQSVVTLRYPDRTPAVQDTINVQAAVPHGAFAQVSTGFFLSTCAVTTRGAGYCWGGQGTSSTDTSGDVATGFDNTPVALTGGLSFAAISRGGMHACGLTTEGAAYCWGDNFNGELGNGGTAPSSTPVAVTGGLTFKAVSAGVYHTCGLTTASAIYCWGNNHAGELGNGATSYTNSRPILVSGGLSFVTVGAGHEYSCGLTTGGEGYCWGDNHFGELGTGDSTFSAVPVRVAGRLVFGALSVGFFHACGLSPDGAASCWGGNFEGELGNGTTQESTSPVAVSGGLSFASISAGQWSTCGVTTMGVAYCWGYNGYGQLGNAAATLTLAPNPTPLPVSGGLTFAAVSTGYLHTCGITTRGGTYCWGDNSMGELGDGSTTIGPTPVLVFGP
jgi:alpha-tubulin suppressor-like RCC1 family protein